MIIKTIRPFYGIIPQYEVVVNIKSCVRDELIQLHINPNSIGQIEEGYIFICDNKLLQAIIKYCEKTANNMIDHDESQFRVLSHNVDLYNQVSVKYLKLIKLHYIDETFIDNEQKRIILETVEKDNIIDAESNVSDIVKIFGYQNASDKLNESLKEYKITYHRQLDFTTKSLIIDLIKGKTVNKKLLIILLNPYLNEEYLKCILTSLNTKINLDIDELINIIIKNINADGIGYCVGFKNDLKILNSDKQSKVIIDLKQKYPQLKQLEDEQILDLITGV
jgi:hypothetical protein